MRDASMHLLLNLLTHSEPKSATHGCQWHQTAIYFKRSGVQANATVPQISTASISHFTLRIPSAFSGGTAAIHSKKTENTFLKILLPSYFTQQHSVIP